MSEERLFQSLEEDIDKEINIDKDNSFSMCLEEFIPSIKFYFENKSAIKDILQVGERYSVYPSDWWETFLPYLFLSDMKEEILSEKRNIALYCTSYVSKKVVELFAEAAGVRSPNFLKSGYDLAGQKFAEALKDKTISNTYNLLPKEFLNFYFAVISK